MVICISLQAGALESAFLSRINFDRATVLSSAAALQGIGTFVGAKFIENIATQKESLPLICTLGAVMMIASGFFAKSKNSNVLGKCEKSLERDA